VRRHTVLIGLLVVLLCGTGHGRTPERFQIASKPIPTPHVAWAKPLPGGPLRMLCLAPIPGQRDVVELAQRLDVEYDLVGFQSPLLHADDAQQFHQLLTEKPYDLVLLAKVPMASLPPQTQTLLLDKIRGGIGLVNVQSMATLQTGQAINVREDGQFLEAGLPLDLLPDGCRPRVKVGRLGQGRCASLAFAAKVACFTPTVDAEKVNYRDWEAYFQVFCRAALWAARREPGAAIESVWPAATVDRQTADSWRTEEVLRTLRPRLLRVGGTWEIASGQQKSPLPTWCGYGASVAVEDGKLKITQCNVNGPDGFAAGTFHVDLARTPILEVTVERATRWSLLVADRPLQRARAVLQPATGQTGAKRFDLRTIQGLAGDEPLVLCFSTVGQGTSLVLGSLRFLDAQGLAQAEEPKSAATADSAAEVILRLRGAADGPATVTATYRGPDYYEPAEQRRTEIALKKNALVEVRFPLLHRCGGRHHAVDLEVRDAQGRSLTFATASYEVVSPVVLGSWAPDKEFYRRGDQVRLVAKFENQAAPREVKLGARLADMHGRLVAVEEKKLSLPSGPSEQTVTLPTDNSLTTLNLARLRVEDAEGELVGADAYVLLPEARPAWNDYLVSTSQFGNTSAYLRPHAIRFARQMGIEGLVIPLRWSVESLKEAAPLMYWGAADVRAFGYNFHGEETSTVRRPCLSDPATRAKISAAYEKVGPALKRYGPLALASLEDESELSGARYTNLEVCTSEHCLRRYRSWLKDHHHSIESLNRQWDTSYASFDQVEPITYDQARKLPNPARWIQWRTFMEHVWLDGLLLTRAGVKKEYPELRMGFSNTFGQMPFSGWNFETVPQHEDMTIEYPTVIFRLAPPKKEGAFEEDAVAMSTVIRQKMDIRRSFMSDDMPSPGWLWYDRSQQGAEFKPWWMAFLGAKGCTPWGPDSLGVRRGAKQMDFWAFVHPQLAHTKSSLWLAESLHDLTRGVGKIFVDYQRHAAPVAVLYSQPSMHLAWAWSETQRAFEPETTSLYAWYYKSRVNVTRMLRELGLSYRYVSTSQIDAGGLQKYRVLVLPCSLCLSEATLEQIGRFVEAGGTVVAALGAGAANEHGRPLPARPAIERVFGVSRQAVARKIEPSELTSSGPAKLEIPAGLKLAGHDALSAAPGAAATHQDGTPALVVHPVGKGKAVYLNGMLGYNMPSRLLLRGLLASAGVSNPIRITSGGAEHMGYECTAFRRGDIEVLGVLRLREETEPTEIKLGRAAHLYDVRGKRDLGRTDTARFDLTQKAAAVLAVLPYEVKGIELQASPGQVAPGQPVSIAACVQATAAPGDHVLRLEVYDPSGQPSRAYTQNILALGGQHQRVLRTALNDRPGRWRVVATEVFSGQRAECEFQVGRD